MKLIHIAAVSRDGVIGKENKLPWHIPEDLKHFKDTTRGCPVVMGRKTFESLGKPLPGRRNVILTQNKEFQPTGCEVVHGISDLVELLKNENTVYCVGGAQIYSLLMPVVDEVLLSEVSIDVDGDTYFPGYVSGHFAVSGFKKVSEVPVECNTPFKIVRYVKG